MNFFSRVRPSWRGAFYGFTVFFFSFSFSARKVSRKDQRHINILPKKEGLSTFACKSKNAPGRIGIFLNMIDQS